MLNGELKYQLPIYHYSFAELSDEVKVEYLKVIFSPCKHMPLVTSLVATVYH